MDLTPNNNKMIYLPENFAEVVKVPGKGIILRRTMKYCRTKSKAGIVLPDDADGRKSFEKKYSVGEVVAVGPDVEETKVGDVVIYNHETAYRIPDADNPSSDVNPRFMRIDETSVHIMAILPGDVPEGE